MKSLGYVHIPIAEHHRWEPMSRRSIATGMGSFNRTTRLMLHQMRWRKPPRQVGLSVVSWVLSLLVHAVVLVAMMMVRPQPSDEPMPRGVDNAIQVRFIESGPPATPVPPPVPPQPRAPKPVRKRVVSRPMARAPVLASVPKPLPVRRRVKVKPASPPAPIPATPDVKPLPTPAKPPAVSKTTHAAKPEPAPASKPVALPKVPSVAKALPKPPPPRVVMETSPMAVPPPKIQINTPSTVQAIVPEPVAPAVDLPAARPQVEMPGLAVDVDVSGPAATHVQAAVKVTPQPSPALPRIDTETMQPRQQIAATPPETVAVPPEPVQIPPTALQQPGLPEVPGAAHKGPRIELGATTGLESVPEFQTQASIPAQVSSVVPPAPVKTPRPQLAQVPDTASWAQSHDDRFSNPATGPGQAGKGRPDGVPDFIKRMPQGNSNVMTRHYKGFHYKPTIFDKYWAPDNQGLLTRWLQDLVDVTSFHKTIDMGRGVRLHCGGWLLGFGCAPDPPQPPPTNADDRRLDMAPAKPLVPGLGASSQEPARPDSAPESSLQSVECATARVAGGPLPPGCGPDAPKSGAGSLLH
jgi:hypothetical protein